MGKKRNTKLASKSSKKQGTSLAEKTEQILLTMPRIIATQISKDLVLLKQQEIKLKNELTKALAQKKKLLAQFSVLKKKKTPAAKKQLTTGQKMLKKTMQLVNLLTQGLEALMKQAKALAHKKAKYSALQTQLVKFAKEWAGKADKKTGQKKKTKIKTKSKKAARKVSAKKQEAYASDAQVIEVIELPVRREFDSAEEPTEKMS